ncbi:MAG TPA: GLPGLI family protein [Cyclobacteriaceae bacterium]|nr:GLPGLI family protein [Cyclobacteriaceae bacterium]
MKKSLIALVLLALVSPLATAVAQNEGVITYEITIDNHRMLPPDMEGRKAMIPQFRTFKQQLFFNANESLYKPLIEDDEEDDAPSGGGGGRFRFRMQGATNYVDQASNTMLTQMDLMGKKYLIADTLKPAPWKFGTEVKTIQGYECMQAYYTTEGDRKQTITAWFTSKLRPNLGPERYNTLPGAILAVDINNGERVFVARKVEVRELKKNELKAPKDGEKITQAEFRQKGEELRKQFGGRGGNVIIR